MLYLIQADAIGHVKLGFTADEDAEARLASLQTGSPVTLRLLGTLPGSLDDEKAYHRRFASARVHGEWFKPIPELLSLVSANPPPVCEGVSMVEQSIAIRVLTVGRKQFSRALLDQLPVAECLRWKWFWAKYEGQVTSELKAAGLQHELVADNYEIADLAHRTPWGWVSDSKGARWAIFTLQDRLFKQSDEWERVHDLVRAYGLEEYSWHPKTRLQEAQLAFLGRLFAKRRSLPGWRDSDQLFFGV